MQTGLENRVVIVTGATANIGRGIALSFAEEGARVVVVGRDAESGERVVRRALERGAADAFWRKTDVTDREAVDGLAADVLERYGQIDVLVNNAGGSLEAGSFVSSSPEGWRENLEINLMSKLYCAHAVLPTMIERGFGRIVNIGSISGVVGAPNLAIYSAAKGGVLAFTRVLALEVGKSGITVNAIAPGRTRSDDPEDAAEGVSTGSKYHPLNGLVARVFAERPEVLSSALRPSALIRERSRPEEIGSAAVYFASDAAEFVTGQVLLVDGGSTLV